MGVDYSCEVSECYSGHIPKLIHEYFLAMKCGKRSKEDRISKRINTNTKVLISDQSFFANLFVLVSCVVVQNRQDNQTRNDHIDHRSTSSFTTTSAAALPPSGQFSSRTATEKWRK